MKRAQQDQRAEYFHEWRKAIKALWYSLRLVGQADARVRRDVRALHLVERWLGDDLNIVVLAETLSRDAYVCSVETMSRQITVRRPLRRRRIGVEFAHLTPTISRASRRQGGNP